MNQILVYGDSLTWGVIPDTRQRLPFSQRWPRVLEAQLLAAGKQVRIIEDCLNGRRTVWDDPFKPGRNGLMGLGQRIEVNSPLALVIVMLGTNDFQATHQNEAWHSAQGLAAIIREIRSAPLEPGMTVPRILIIAPPPVEAPKGSIAPKFFGAEVRSAGMGDAYRKIAVEEDCSFFDSSTVISASVVDGIHLDADQHERLGKALVTHVIKLFPTQTMT